MERIECDVCVIGAGSGGLSFAAGASQMGAKVVLLEGHKMGGDCLNYGCVPSKALLAAGKAARSQGKGAQMGVSPQVAQVDFAVAKDHVADVIAGIEPHDSEERFEGLGVRVIRAFGQFLNEKEVAAGDHVIRARRFVIATGSRAVVPPIPGLAEVPYHTNETLFEDRDQPEHLLIIGAGPIGLEMAQAHRRLGSAVTVIEADRALNRDDPEAAAEVLSALRAEGVVIHEGLGAARIDKTTYGVAVTLADDQVIEGSHLLVAVGRAPAIDTLRLEAAGVAYTRASITVDAGLRTRNRRVYAIGDAAGLGQFTHLAGYHAGVVIRPILLGLPAKARLDHVPRVTYSDPELAQIGQTEHEARAAHGDRVSVVKVPLDSSDRARTDGLAPGFVKVMVVKGRPVGATIVGSQAGELIALWAMAMANNLKMSAISATVLPYPTLMEVNKRAAGAYFSPKLFDSPAVKRVVRFVQTFLP